jgi:hypothetical protein
MRKALKVLPPVTRFIFAVICGDHKNGLRIEKWQTSVSFWCLRACRGFPFSDSATDHFFNLASLH